MKSLRNLKEEYQREIELNRTTISSLRQSLHLKDEQIAELDERLDKYNGDMKSEQNSAILYETDLNQSRIFALKKELESTVSRMQQSEGLNLETVSKLEVALSREREKSGGLVLRLGEMEEQMRVCVQELDMYRSLDIYQVSKESQLKAMRSTKASIESPQVMSLQSSLFKSQSPPPEMRDGRFDIKDLSIPQDQSILIQSFRSKSGAGGETRGQEHHSNSTASGNVQSALPKMPSMKEFEKAKKLLLSSSRW